MNEQAHQLTPELIVDSEVAHESVISFDGDWSVQVALGDFGTSEADLSGSCGWDGPGPHDHDRLSPISYASMIRTPVLILHGEEHTNVPLGQATYFHRALSRFGVEHEFIVYPREGHGLQERSHQLD